MVGCIRDVSDVFYRKADKHLNTSYKLDDVEKQLKGPAVAPDSLLYDFVKLIGVSPDDFVAAVRSGSLPKQESLRRRINRLVNDKINAPFAIFIRPRPLLWIWGSIRELYLLLLHPKMEKP